MYIHLCTNTKGSWEVRFTGAQQQAATAAALYMFTIATSTADAGSYALLNALRDNK